MNDEKNKKNEEEKFKEQLRKQTNDIFNLFGYNPDNTEKNSDEQDTDEN